MKPVGSQKDAMMYSIQHKIPVMLEFRAMPAPVEISVPLNVVRYLDKHADRYFGPDGSVVYRLRSGRVSLPFCVASNRPLTPV